MEEPWYDEPPVPEGIEHTTLTFPEYYSTHHKEITYLSHPECQAKLHTTLIPSMSLLRGSVKMPVQIEKCQFGIYESF